MCKDYQRRWNDVAKGPEKAGAIPTLGKILADKEGRDFILGLGHKETELCLKLSDRVSSDLHSPLSPPHTVRQGIVECKPAEKKAFFVTLRRLAERHGKLPERMMITETIEVSDEIFAFGGFGVVREGTYKGERVAVKTAKIPLLKNFDKIRKVSINGIFVPTRRPVSAILLQRFYREVVLWSTLSHPNILKFLGVHEDTKKRQFSTVSEWIGGGNIMEFINANHVNRLELVNDITFSVTFHPLKFAGSYTTQPRVSGTSTVSASHTVTSKGSVSPRFVTDSLLTFNRRTSSCPTVPLLVPASRTLISLLRSSTLTKSSRAVRKQRVARCSSCLRNSWCPRSLVWKAQNLPRRRTSTRLDWSSSKCANRITGVSRSHIPFLGPYRRNPVPWCSGLGDGISRASWEAPGQTGERLHHRIFRFAVGFHPKVLGWRNEIATKG